MLVDIVGQSAQAIIIGKGSLSREVARNLQNRQLSSDLIETQTELDPTLEPEFVFWFPESSSDVLSEFLTNFLISLKPKFIIVGYDDMDIAGMVSAAVEKNLDVRGVSVYDLYGPHVAESRLSLLWSKIAHRELVLPDQDQDVASPIYVEDAAEAICLVALSSQTYNHVVVVTGAQEMTVLNVAYRIRDRFIQLTGELPAFRHEKGAGPVVVSRRERIAARDQAFKLLSWQPSTDLSEGLRRLVPSVAAQTPSPEIQEDQGNRHEESPTTKKKINPSTRPAQRDGAGFHLLNPGEPAPELPAPSPVLVMAQRSSVRSEHPFRRFIANRFLRGIAIVMIGTGLIWAGSWMSVRLIDRLAIQMLDRLSVSARSGAADLAEKQYQQLIQLSEIRGVVQSVRAGEDNGTLSRLVARAGVEFRRARAQDSLTTIAGIVSGDTREYPSVRMSSLESDLTALLTSFASLSQFPDEWARYAELRQETSLARELIPIVKWVLGFGEKRTILLVVQNSSELRPTGGFLAGIGFLTFEKGRLLDVTFMDIDSIDAQLTGAERPPEPIRRLMGEDLWRARDANWNPDGPQAATHIERVVTRATGRSVDGTVFLTSQGIRRILSKTGPVLSPQGDEFSAENIIERVTFEGGVSLDFGQTTEPLLDAVRGLRGSFTKDNAIRFALGILDAANHQELFLTVHQPDIAQALSLVGFDGAIGASTCPMQFHSARCMSDFLGVFDANLSVNRADYFLERERNVHVTLAPSTEPTVTVTLVYRNTATTTARPAGVYHGYTRVMVPLDAVITAMVEEKDGKSLEVIADHDVQYGKRVEGFYLHVPVGSATTIRMSYTRGTPFTLDNGIGGYNLLLQKQPGVDSAPTSITVDHGPSIGPIGISPDAYSQDHSLLFDLVGDRTTNIAVEFMSVL